MNRIAEPRARKARAVDEPAARDRKARAIDEPLNQFLQGNRVHNDALKHIGKRGNWFSGEIAGRILSIVRLRSRRLVSQTVDARGHREAGDGKLTKVIPAIRANLGEGV